MLWANQWDNVANCRAHFETTGPEIWRQTGERVDGFICAVGTGKALKQRNPDIRVVLADPMGASLYGYFKEG